MVNLADLYRSHVAHLQAEYGRALEAQGVAALLIHAGAIQAVSRFDDREWPFKPTPAFAHWLPLVEPDSWLVFEPGKRARVLRCYQAGYWDGPAAPVPDWVWQEVEARTIPAAELPGELPTGRIAFVGEDPARAEALGIAAINPPALVAAFDQIRARKTEYELECIAAATRRAVAGHDRAFALFRARAASELELQLEYLEASGQDAFETPYKNIVALCQNASVLHHVSYGRSAPPAARSLLVDAGASAHGYACDITRTEATGGGEAVRIFTELIARVDRMQQELCRRVVPGLAYESLHDQCHALIAPILRELDLVRAGDDELVDSGATRRFLPHGLGHSLGIQVHDVGCKLTPPRPDNPWLRNTSAIAVGQVFTIEPGVYFIPALLDQLRGERLGGRVNWPLVEELAPLGGVRIEDNIAVTADGIRNLTREAWQGSAHPV
jgi:Xaa-Pro dipeptidase